MGTVKESFGQLIHLLEEKDQETGKIWPGDDIPASLRLYRTPTHHRPAHPGSAWPSCKLHCYFNSVTVVKIIEPCEKWTMVNPHTRIAYLQKKKVPQLLSLIPLKLHVLTQNKRPTHDYHTQLNGCICPFKYRPSCTLLLNRWCNHMLGHVGQLEVM